MPPAIRILSAHESDTGLLCALEQILFPEDAWTEGMIREELASPYSDYLLAIAAEEPDAAAARDGEGGGAVIGYGGIKTVGDAADVMTIGVLPQARRLGVGRAILDALLVRSARRGAAAAFLEVRESNTGARALYEAAGFTESGRIRRYFRNPVEDAITMTARLGRRPGAD